ncbi:hypothetical protein TNCV_801321 [Trichonephila clavipes]|nr:hypothetical protein TNCV_801321 [Trichonephila clavipes]
MRIATQTDSALICKEYSSPFIVSPIPLFLHHRERLLRWAGVKDLNPIENVWDALGRQVAGRNYPLTNKNTLIRALIDEWDKIASTAAG